MTRYKLTSIVPDDGWGFDQPLFVVGQTRFRVHGDKAYKGKTFIVTDVHDDIGSGMIVAEDEDELKRGPVHWPRTKYCWCFYMKYELDKGLIEFVTDDDWW